MISAKTSLWAEVDAQGRLVLPAEVATRYGLQPGARARLDTGENELRLHRPVTQLVKIYVEPTNRCNLACRTCIRNQWDVEFGHMADETFERIMQSAAALEPPFTVFFGGLGEPLSHRRIVDMVRRAKSLGANVELITNGTLLNETLSRELIAAGLDVLWVSIDGARPESFADVRLGAALPEVLANVRRFRTLRPPAHRPRPEIAMAFVAMKRNIAELPEVLALGRRLGASRCSVSNLLPHTPEMCSEILYDQTLHDITYLPSPWLKRLNLPKMDLDATTGDAFLQALSSGYNVTFAGNNLGGANDVCTFIESGSLTIGWDGSVSPCPPLLYDHVSYLHGRPRHSQRHIVGRIAERSLLEIWLDPDYAAYRDRVQRFAFAPCTFCGGCDLSENNLTDCFGNPAPACGGCLWAQAIIQCP